MSSDPSPSPRLLKWGDEELAWFDQASAGQIADLIRSGRVRGVALSRRQGFQASTLLPLLDLPPFKCLVVTDPEGIDLSALPRFPELSLLSLGEGKRTPLQFQDLAALSDLTLTWTVGDKLPAATSKLQRLVLRKYKPTTGTLEGLPGYESLTRLELVQASVRSLEGVGMLKQLRSLEIDHCRELGSVHALMGSELEMLRIANCKQVSDVRSLAGHPTLKILVLADMPTLPSLDFVSNMPALEEFRFVKTEVADGDLRPLFGLRRVGFLNRRGFSHTVEQVQAEIDRRSAP